MSPLEDEIRTLGSNLGDVYAKLEEAGAEMPEQKNFANLAPTIATTPTARTDYGMLTYKSGGELIDYVLKSDADFQLLGNSGNETSTIKLSGLTLTKDKIRGFEFGSKNTSIPNYFMFRCENLRTVGKMTSKIQSIGLGFCQYCIQLASPIIISNSVKSIGINFLAQCTNFNDIVIFGNKVESVGARFMYSCQKFNQPLTLPTNIQSIGDEFMTDCRNFNQSLTLPVNLQRIGGSFMHYVKNFVGPLIIQTGAMPQASDTVLDAWNNSDPAYVNGIAIQGAGAPAWKEAFPDFARRKLILLNDYTTFTELISALNNNIAESTLPVGIKISDTYDDAISPWTVMQYGKATMDDGSLRDGVYLVRLIAEPDSVFGSSADYGTSTVHSFLQNEYLNKCSNEFANAVSEIKVPYFNGLNDATVNAKCWLLSATEIINQGAGHIEGFGFDLWKYRTGLNSPDSLGVNNSGRVMYGANSVAKLWWTRSYYNSSSSIAVNASGATGTSLSSTSYGLVVACFIAKGEK